MYSIMNTYLFGEANPVARPIIIDKEHSNIRFLMKPMLIGVNLAFPYVESDPNPKSLTRKILSLSLSPHTRTHTYLHRGKDNVHITK